MKRQRGTGSIFTMPKSRYLWIQYHRNGISIRESCHTDNRKLAEKILQKRLAEILTGSFTGPKLEKVMVTELAENLMREYKINARKSFANLETRWRLHLKPFFGHLRAVQVTSALVNNYIDSRQQEGAENASINRECAILKRAFNLAHESTPPTVLTIPYIQTLKEDNTRTGFLEPQQYEKLAVECSKQGLWLRAILEVGNTLGWRIGEILGLKVMQVNLLENTIRLEPGTTKNLDGREVSMTSTVRTLLEMCCHGKQPDDFVFTRKGGKNVKAFVTSWRKVCKAAGVPDLLFHDLRRSAARNLRAAGVAESVIMQIGGWRTRAMFDRYAIVSQADKKDAMAKLEAQFSQSLSRAAQQTVQTESTTKVVTQ